ncbi:pyridoxamine 5'-phosphate oxidase family protein [Patescibacteria group bacterium]|nr:pyridoxamine 5'-phosphate oxidase family protein [Patescibacteria group bacterium]MBU1755355.1 pyridoxamine 5'-phosphate oxidase family protein [Patescibacteria group bacterium]
MTLEQKTEAALAFLQSHRSGVLATLSPEGAPHARLLYFSADKDFNIHFLTLSTTRKVKDIETDPRAAFVVAAEDVPQTLQIQGVLEDRTDTAVNDPIVNHLFDNLKSNTTYFAPLTRFDPGKVFFYRLKPTSVRWGDFTHGHSTDEVFTELHKA